LDVVLHIAAKLGHVDLVRAISMREGLVVNVPAKNKRGETPLHCAAANGNVDMIDLLILMAGEVGAMQLLSERNHNGETCLHEAVRCGNIEAAKRLDMADLAVQHYRDICRGRALVQIEDDEGVSPLYLATTLCRFEIVRCLTEREQDARYSASYTGPEKKTAMHAAVLVSKGVCYLAK
jgi:ankyrin repeat protein